MFVLIEFNAFFNFLSIKNTKKAEPCGSTLDQIGGDILLKISPPIFNFNITL